MRAHEKAMEYFMETLPGLPQLEVEGQNHTFSRELLISLLRNFTVCETPHVLSTLNAILSKLLHIDLNHSRGG